MEPPYLLFDDAREGGARPRLYRAPHRVIEARTIDEVRPALAALKAAVAAGAHAAGYLAYEAGYALDPKLAAAARQGAGPLLWFGLFERYETPAIDGDGPPLDIGAPRPRIGWAAYRDAAARVREGLFAGDYYQANLTFGCDVAVVPDLDPLALFRQLRRRSRAGWGGVIDIGERWIVSLSPEQFFSIRGGKIEARPMKGTAPRRADPAADAAEALGLAADPKQRAENMMIVDLMRNDLARLAETGSVAVPELFAVESYPTVHQMVSRIVATLRPGIGAVDALETIFPCGSVTGAPKIAAMLALRDLEPEPRGAYTGSMGWIEPGAHGDAAFNVLIRTLAGEKGASVARLGLGSGLVVDSVAREEWGECLLKGEFLRVTSRPFDLIETMRFDPHEGIADLDRHLARLTRATGDLGFRFDRHAARNELQAATFGRKERAMVRLLLSKTGAMAIEVKGFDDPDAVPVRVALRPLPVPADDFRLRYKTSDRGFYDRARREGGAYETVFVDPDGRITEGSRTNVFVERDGRLLTPRGGALFAGVLREKLIEEGRAEEAELTADDLKGGFFVGNIVRGLIPAVLAD
ncbi:chorismate-binding protein [Sphingomonas sp. ASV193]|uniref:chorismate-binding protein n=1 Tax=Sphingomonas sp. ASV193 TaxID=3144405 RepID=UPI0032E879EE